MKTEQDLIFEAYLNNGVEQDDNEQFTPQEGPVEDEVNEIEPLESDEEEATKEIVKALNEIVAELKTLNQYADFITTGTRAQGFTGTGKLQ